MKNLKLSTLDRFNKKEAFGAALTLKREGSLSLRDIDMLLNYFAPPLPKKANFAEQWVALACGVKDVRMWTKYLHVVKGVAHGTDGHRMHWTKTKFPDGVYCPKTLLPAVLPENGLRVPDFDRLKKDCETLEKIDLEGAPCHAYKRGTVLGQVKPLALKTGVDVSYLLAAVGCGAEYQIFVDRQDYDWGVQGESKFGEFRIMGMRI